MTWTNGQKPHNFIQEGCDVEGCDKKHRAGGLCAGHYHRMSRYKSIYTPGERKAHEEERTRIIKYLLAKKVIRQGMLGGEYVAMDVHGEEAVSLSIALRDEE